MELFVVGLVQGFEFGKVALSSPRILRSQSGKVVEEGPLLGGVSLPLAKRTPRNFLFNFFDQILFNAGKVLRLEVRLGADVQGNLLSSLERRSLGFRGRWIPKK